MDATAAPKTKNKNTRLTFGSKIIAKQNLAKSRAKFEGRKRHSATAACAALNTERVLERGWRVAGERLLGVAVASLSSGAQPIGCSGVLWDMFGCGPLLRHGLLLLLLQLRSESSRAGMCGALPKTHKAGLSFFRRMRTGFRHLIGSADFPSGRFETVLGKKIYTGTSYDFWVISLISLSLADQLK